MDKNMKVLNHSSRFPACYFNPRPPNHEAAFGHFAVLLCICD